jgi:hypothetical protein
LQWENSGNTGQNPGAIFQFGEALHTTTDSASPWHNDYHEIWGGMWDPAGSLQHGASEKALGFLQKAALAEARWRAEMLWDRYQQQLKEARKKQEEDKRKEEEKKKCEKDPQSCKK